MSPISERATCGGRLKLLATFWAVEGFFVRVRVELPVGALRVVRVATRR
jgi:hypothetical protein